MIVDVNTAVGRWPFSEAQSRPQSGLSALLARAGVDLALASSLEAIFHEDPDEDNERLFRQLRGHKRLLPVPVINPRLADWRVSVGKWAQKTAALKILPSFHGYSLAEACVSDLAAELADRRRTLFVQIRMEDERTQAPAFRAPPVPPADIVALAKRFPRLSIVALGAYTPEAVQLLGQSPGVFMDISFLDGLDTVGVLVRKHRAFARRLLLGSNLPLFYAQSAVLKVQTAETTAAVRRAILGENARKILGL